MTRKQEIENVSVLEPMNRYRYFIKKIADYEELWVLENGNGDAAIAEVDNHVLIPFWSASEFTESCRKDEWAEYQPAKLSLEEMEKKLFPLIREKNYLIDVFPVGDRSGFVVTIDEFVRDLCEELENYA